MGGKTKFGAGVFRKLDDTCKAKKKDKDFYNGINKLGKKHDLLLIAKFPPKKYKGTGLFTIVHTAEPVEYDSTGMVFKNKDEI